MLENMYFTPGVCKILKSVNAVWQPGQCANEVFASEFSLDFWDFQRLSVLHRLGFQFQVLSSGLLLVFKTF